MLSNGIDFEDGYNNDGDNNYNDVANQQFSNESNICVDCKECEPLGIYAYLISLLTFGFAFPLLFGGKSSTPRRKPKVLATKKKSMNTIANSYNNVTGEIYGKANGNRIKITDYK